MLRETSEDSDSSDIENDQDWEMLRLQNTLKAIKKNVAKLRMRKLELEEQLQSPMEFGDVLHTQQEVASGAEIEENLKQAEQEHYVKRLFFHKLAGMRPVLQENNDIVFEFNASVRGHYYQPYYLRARKVQRGNYEIVNYFLPDSILVREMVDSSVNDKELYELLDKIQSRVVAYHRRKAQITEVKETLKNTKLFYSTDYKFLEFKVQTDGLNVSFNLIYDDDKDIPSTVDVICKEADKKTLTSLKEDCNVFLQLPLDEAIKVLFLKELSSSTSFSSLSTVQHNTERRNDFVEEEIDDDDDADDEDDNILFSNDYNKAQKKGGLRSQSKGASKNNKKRGSKVK